MARAVGQDVDVRVLLMGEVAELRQELHVTRAHTRIMAAGLGSMLTSMGALREDMASLRANMDAMMTNMATVAGELRGLSNGLQRMDAHAGHMARLLGALEDSEKN